MNKNRKGFTLVELVIVIIIVGILSVVSVPVYQGYTRKAYLTEAEGVLGGINTAQTVYFAKYNYFRAHTAYTTEEPELGISTIKNKYFRKFKISAKKQSNGEYNWTATTTGMNRARGLTAIAVGNSYGETNVTCFDDEGKTIELH